MRVFIAKVVYLVGSAYGYFQPMNSKAFATISRQDDFVHLLLLIQA